MNDDKDRWIKEHWTDSIYCPICEYIFDIWDDETIKKKYRHCPHCGTRLYPPKEGND